MSLPVFVLGLILLGSSGCFGDVSHLVPTYYNVETTTIPPSPPVPYSFHYKAGRFPGNIDRFQSESGDGSGNVHGITLIYLLKYLNYHSIAIIYRMIVILFSLLGTYSYIDPKFKIRTVDYTADKNGFHPVLKNFEDIQVAPQDTEAVKLEKERHYQLYHRIASNNANPQTVDESLPKVYNLNIIMQKYSIDLDIYTRFFFQFRSLRVFLELNKSTLNSFKKLPMNMK